MPVFGFGIFYSDHLTDLTFAYNTNAGYLSKNPDHFVFIKWVRKRSLIILH